jgi:hypothetical protein
MKEYVEFSEFIQKYLREKSEEFQDKRDSDAWWLDTFIDEMFDYIFEKKEGEGT